MKRSIIGLPSLLAVILLSLSSAGCQQGSRLGQIHAPIVKESIVSPTKLETVWSRIAFGKYPTREITSGAFVNLQDYAYTEGDYLLKPSLFNRLAVSDWKDRRTVFDGVEYEMIAEDGTSSAQQHYNYLGPEGRVHFFECQPIEWRVLALEGSKAVLMADRAMDCLPYNGSEEGVTWKRSSVRSYLNSLDEKENDVHVSFAKEGFLDRAFSERDKEALLPHVSEISVNRDYGTSSGEKCEDYVYLLDQDELFASEKAASYGFYNGRGFDDPAKRFKSTTFAKFKGCWYSPVTGYRGNCFHFMRTSGYRDNYISYICDFGYVYSRGTSSDCFDAGIIPVIDVDLSKADYSVIPERSSLSILQNAVESGDFSDAPTSGKWDIVEYGEYPQDEVTQDDDLYARVASAEWEEDVATLDGKRFKRLGERYFAYQPIRWRILEKQGSSALLFSSVGLDCHSFHSKLAMIDWPSSAIRKFLNGEFLEEAFPIGEEAILEKVIENKENYYFGTDSGEESKDKAFLLSESDVFGEDAATRHGFAPSDATNDEGRRIAPSDYAKAKGAWTSKDGNGFYSLRTSGYNKANSVYVGELGDIYNRGIPVTCPDMTLVPAMWVDLSLLPSSVD